tara:strand:- start:403 stop:1002 length:600 start_codon:yes stop_codon:yes gene_type:complete
MSNARNLANLLGTGSTIATAKIADDAITSAKIADDAVTSASIANGTANTPVVFNNVSAALTTSSGWQQSGSISIPESGIWHVECFYRIRWGGNTYYIKSALGTSSSNGSGLITEHRMILERITTNTFGNYGMPAYWFIDCPLGATYPLTLYSQIHYQSADFYNGNNNDSNGVPYIKAMKMYESTTSGSTVDDVTSKTSL